ncbi:GNAT family N-acetyltransferase [Desulfospira joergensenii]|uniref:GNAT family N-acetyltransferase n=1 Tax=Desulfospira joergensenii TaxID=53329 RepID=UPI0003B794E7|nr:GNAT family N-acetyltransferase [Desulfospira joergensenii]
MKHGVYTEPEQCRRIWEEIWPAQGIFDLWPVRFCFQEAYSNPLQFHTIEQGGKILGCLPLSWNEETGQYVLFPGETWKGKTWLEQNRIPVTHPEILNQLLDDVPGSLHLRYLSWNPVFEGVSQTRQDEEGYLFYPGMYDYSFENYWLGFSGKSRKKIRTEFKRFEDRNLSFRFNNTADLDHLFEMNQRAFACDSYFNDPKFFNAFDRLASFLSEMGMLRIVTISIDGEIAAVDMGAVFNNTYTLFAGGTSLEFPGIAKMINLHHMEWACQKQFNEVDFLCGDFNWKKRFHLLPRPLYEIEIQKPVPQFEWYRDEKQALCA